MATEDHQKFLPQTPSTTKTSMAPSRYETNRDIALLADLGMGYKKIAKCKNMPVSTVQGVVKRYRMRGSVQDAPRSGRPTKQTLELKQHIEATIDENPWASLRLRKRFSKNVNERLHSENELWAVMEEEWEAMDQAVIDRLIDSMPLRLQAIIKAGGSHIKW